MNSTLPKPESRQANGNAERVSFLTPITNVREDKDGYILEAEMPGVSKDGLEVTVESGELVIVGRRTPSPAVGQLLHRESRGRDYRRVFELDGSIDSTKISAKIDQGVVVLHLPKAEAVKPRKIAVE